MQHSSPRLYARKREPPSRRASNPRRTGSKWSSLLLRVGYLGLEYDWGMGGGFRDFAFRFPCGIFHSRRSGIGTTSITFISLLQYPHETNYPSPTLPSLYFPASNCQAGATRPSLATYFTVLIFHHHVVSLHIFYIRTVVKKKRVVNFPDKIRKKTKKAQGTE